MDAFASSFSGVDDLESDPVRWTCSPYGLNGGVSFDVVQRDFSFGNTPPFSCISLFSSFVLPCHPLGPI